MKTHSGNHDIYLVLCESAHGLRYWRTTTDPQLESDRVKWFGPAIVGPDGYKSEEEAAEELAACEAFIRLDKPEEWWEDCSICGDMAEEFGLCPRHLAEDDKELLEEWKTSDKEEEGA